MSYWKFRLANISHVNIHPTLHHLGIKDTGSKDRQYIKIQLKLAWQALHNTQKKADILRTTHLEDLANYKAEQEGSTASM